MKKKYLIIPGLALIITIIMMIWFEDFVDIVILTPISYGLWILRLIFESFHQQVIWISFLLIAAILILASLTPERKGFRREEEGERKYPNRIEIWERHLTSLRGGKHLRWGTGDHIGELLINALAYRYSLSRDQVFEKLNADEFSIPDEVKLYIAMAYKASAFRETLLKKMGFSSLEQAGYNLPPVENVINFLEEQVKFNGNSDRSY